MFCVYSFILCHYIYFFFFFFNDTATTEIYTLSLHDALPISNFNRTRAVSSVGQSVCLTSRRSSVRAGYRPPLTSLAERSEEHTSELQSQSNLVCRLLLEKKKKKQSNNLNSHHSTISQAVLCY